MNKNHAPSMSVLLGYQMTGFSAVLGNSLAHLISPPLSSSSDNPYCFGVAVRRQGLTLQPQLGLNSQPSACLSFLKAGHWCQQ